ncbi:MAG TPA: serine hydrolase, partial [Actinophytocola sp.]|uniref:serine hydrolase n=1 Tax=Actinophytocola sp. TaxID=1872138 RepID=UPI002F92B809
GLTVACGQPAAILGAPPGPPVPVQPNVTTSAPPVPMPKNPAPERKHTKPKPRPELPARIPGRILERAAAGVEPGTTLGAMVFDRTTGELRLEYNADRPFRSASLVKLLIAIDVLAQGADGPTRQQVAEMLRMSDDDLASMFWVKYGGPQIVTRTSAELGLSGVRPPEAYGRWGEVVVTPRDIVAIYRHVLKLPPADRTLIVDALANAPRQAADGFDQHFGIPDGLHAEWAIKQGWGSNSSAMVLHSTGLAGPGFRYIVVLLTEHPLGSGWRTAARSVTAAATAMNGRLPGVA